MNEEPEQQSEWRRRITQSMAATTYEQLKALVEGVSGGFGEVSDSFATLAHHLDQIESALNEARLGFGHEAERVRASFAEHANAVSDRVENVSSDLVLDLREKTQEISAQLAAIGGEISARLQELRSEQREQLGSSHSALTEAAASIPSRVDAAVSELSKELGSRGDATAAAVRASAAMTKGDLDRLMRTFTSLRDEHVAISEASTVPLATAIEDLRRRLEETNDLSTTASAAHAARLTELAQHLDDEVRRLKQETATAISESRTAISDLIAGGLEELLARVTDLRSGAGSEEVSETLRGVLREQTDAAATRWDDLVGQLAARRGGEGLSSGDDLVLVALIRSLEQVLDARDQRFMAMLEESARSLPARRRRNFMARAAQSFKLGEKGTSSHRPPD